MEFKINENTNNINVFLAGHIVLGEIAELKDQIIKLANNNDKDIIIDFNKVDYLDSTGIGFLLRLSSIQKSKNRSFNIKNLPERIKKIIELSSLGDFI